MLTFLTSADIERIRSGEFSLDCLNMALSQKDTGEVRFAGAGSIAQRDGELGFVLYAPGSSMSTADWFETHLGKTNRWLEDRDFHTLAATDMSGRVWRSEWILLDASVTAYLPGVVARGRLQDVSTELASDHPSAWVHAFAPTDAAIPTSDVTQTKTVVRETEQAAFERNVWIIDTPLGELRMTKQQGGIDIRMTSSTGTLPPDIAGRLEEATTFMLASPLQWTVEQVKPLGGGPVRITIRNPRPVIRRPRLRPPIDPNSGEALHDCDVLLQAYLKFIIANPPEPGHYHPLAISVARVLRASSSAIEDEALALSVEVESVVARYFGNLGLPAPEIIRHVQAGAEYIRRWAEGDPTTRKRMIDVVGNLAGPHPRTALNQLTQLGVIDAAHVQAWKNLRNPATHGARSSGSIRELATACNVVHELMLLLIFRVIEYELRFSDRSPEGGLKNVPAGNLPQSESAPDAVGEFDPTWNGTTGEVT